MHGEANKLSYISMEEERVMILVKCLQITYTFDINNFDFKNNNNNNVFSLSISVDLKCFIWIMVTKNLLWNKYLYGPMLVYVL